jgi:hypothetical protein
MIIVNLALRPMSMARWMTPTKFGASLVSMLPSTAAMHPHTFGQKGRARVNGDRLSAEVWDDIADVAEVLLASVRH